MQSPSILKSYIGNGLLEVFPMESIEIINQEIAKLNQQGIVEIKEKK
jgi:hypothetical protein